MKLLIFCFQVSHPKDHKSLLNYELFAVKFFIWIRCLLLLLLLFLKLFASLIKKE